MKQSRPPNLQSDFAEAEPSFADIMAALDAHELWIRSEKREGKKLTSEELPVEVKGLSFDGRKLQGCDLRAVEFLSCSMRGVDWTDADVSGSHFTDCDLGGGATNFDRANLQLCRFRNCPGVELASFVDADLWLAEIPGVTPQGNSPRESWISNRPDDFPKKF
jgi:uncharacterized protein YjbI with pentapeptide repeats